MSNSATTETNRPATFRVALYDSIRRAAHQQCDALRSDDIDLFHDLLVERERLLAKAEDVGRVLASNVSREDASDRAAAASIVREILGLDQEMGEILNEKIARTRVEASRVGGGRSAVQGYGHLRLVGESQFINQRG